MPDYTDLNAAIDAAEATALGGNLDGELGTHRALAIDAYLGKNLEPAPEGRSQVVDRTVFEVIQWIMPSLTRIFAGDDNVVEFEPFGPEDEDGAEQESDYLNYLVTQRNNWFQTILTWFTDALLTKNAYCMGLVEEKKRTETITYKGQTAESMALILDEEGIELVEANEYPDPDWEPQYVDAFSGQPIDPQFVELAPLQGLEPIEVPPPMLYDIRVRKTTPSKSLKFVVLPPENVKVDKDTPDFTLREADYFEYCEDMTISELRSCGYDVPDDIADDGYEESEEDDARNEYTDQYGDYDSPDPSMRKVRRRIIWIRYDYDGDGIAEMQRVVRVGREILDREEATRIPVASIVPFPNSHRHSGMSLADITFDLQRIRTALTRAGLDSTNLANNPRHAVSEAVNLDDMLVSHPGGLVRLKNGAIPLEGHIMPIVTEFTLPQTLEALRHMDTVVESRTGVNRMFQGIDESSLNDHNRIGQLSTMAAQRVEQIARVFANGVEDLFSIAHELIIREGHQKEVVRLRGQWVEIDPSNWKTGRDMRVVAPFAAGNKDALLQRLMILRGIHAEALAGGLPIVTPDDSYELALEISKAMDVRGQKFFTAPDQIPQPEPPPDYTMMALEIENKKADNQARADELEAQIKEVDLQLKSADGERQAALEKYKVDLNAELQLALAQIKEGSTLNVENLKAQLRDKPIFDANNKIDSTDKSVQALNKVIQDVTKSVLELKSAAESPREVVRDKKGRVTGIKMNGQTRNVKRDKEGKVTGI